ncbi:MAG TPA: ABC transporter permease [Mycobacteriales bacterium]|nr:ABC transporter permease [Mycobacteriales bacterium]
MPADGPVGGVSADPAPDQSLDSLERGLDELTAVDPDHRSVGQRLARSVLPPLVAIGLILLAWQILVWAKVKPRYTLPSIGDVWGSLREQWQDGTLQHAVWLSVSRGLLGFAIAIAIGLPLGLLVARVWPLRAALRPLLSGLQTLPSVAWVPAAIVWFALSPATIYFVVLMGAVPSIAVGTISGIDQIPPTYHRVGRVLGARGLRAAWHIVLPAALPACLGGLKQGWAFAWRSLMAAELIAQSPRLGTGLGQLLETGRDLSDISLVFGMIIAILLVGIAIDQLLFSPLERSVLRRRGLLTG